MGDLTIVLDRRARAVEGKENGDVYAACARVIGVNMLMLIGLVEDGIYSLDYARASCNDLARAFLAWSHRRDGEEGARTAARALDWVVNEIILRWYMPSPALPMLTVPTRDDLDRMVDAIARQDAPV